LPLQDNQRKEQCQVPEGKIMDGSRNIAIGLGGWEHEILDRCFYHDAARSSLEKLAFYAAYFDFTEVRASFWDDSLTLRDAEDWVSAVGSNRRFKFGIKLHQSFTHKREVTPRTTRGVREILHGLARHNRLAGLLAQFPYSFTNTGSTRFHLVKLGEIFSGFPVFVELRHSSWDNGSLRHFLADNLLQPVNVDLPRLKGMMSCRSDVVGDGAYLRLHGRNEKGWLLNGIDARYDYLYNLREIREILRRADCLAQKAKHVIVVCNNTTGGKAVANAFQLKAAVSEGKNLLIPENTLRVFPHLQKLALPNTGQMNLPALGNLREVG
jgi:uncharacterized protein YecE (DUF72 family)